MLFIQHDLIIIVDFEKFKEMVQNANHKPSEDTLSQFGKAQFTHISQQLDDVKLVLQTISTNIDCSIVRSTSSTTVYIIVQLENSNQIKEFVISIAKLQDELTDEVDNLTGRVERTIHKIQLVHSLSSQCESSVCV